MSDLYRPDPTLNLLNLPLIGPLLRKKRGRLLGQLILLVVTGFVIYDGFTGPQFAPENMATVLTWVHYRGLVVFGFLLLGNLFCMGCPFTLPRTLAKKLAIRGGRWPNWLRNKWLAGGLLFLFFYLYEWLNLWASPLLTVWIIVGYFLASFVLEAFFAESPFCKYVCPLGTFNFLSSTISPLQIQVADHETCRTCVGRECVNGATQTPGEPVKGRQGVIRLDAIEVLGCGTELFAPQIESNLDCTFCLDCARACPHDNIALAVRHPLREPYAVRWPLRWDLSLLVLVFTYTALGNAFGMVGPIFALEAWLGATLGTPGEGIPLLIIFGVTNLLLPLLLGLGSAWLSRSLNGRQQEERLLETLARYVPAFLPLAFALWLAHYGGFHFLGSAGTIVPVFKNFLLDHNILWLGRPDWTMGPVLPLNWLDPLEMGVVLLGLLASLGALGRRAKLDEEKVDRPLATLPWAVQLLAITIFAFWIFFLPMEMRGTAFFS